MKVTDPLGHVTRYAYGTRGRHDKVTDARGNVLIANNYASWSGSEQTLGQGTYRFTYEIPGCVEPEGSQYAFPGDCEYVARVETPTGVTADLLLEGTVKRGREPGGALRLEKCNPGKSPTVRIDNEHEHRYRVTSRRSGGGGNVHAGPEDERSTSIDQRHQAHAVRLCRRRHEGRR